MRARVTCSSSRFTVSGWASSVLGLAPDVDVSHKAGSAGTAFVVLVAIAVAGWLLAEAAEDAKKLAKLGIGK